jgi:hypothetical protein
VIPRGGYRAEDMIDEALGPNGADLDRAAADARMAAIVRGLGMEHPSMEVREPAGVYRVSRLAA